MTTNAHKHPPMLLSCINMSHVRLLLMRTIQSDDLCQHGAELGEAYAALWGLTGGVTLKD